MRFQLICPPHYSVRVRAEPLLEIGESRVLRCGDVIHAECELLQGFYQLTNDDGYVLVSIKNVFWRSINSDEDIIHDIFSPGSGEVSSHVPHDVSAMLEGFVMDEESDGDASDAASDAGRPLGPPMPSAYADADADFADDLENEDRYADGDYDGDSDDAEHVFRGQDRKFSRLDSAYSFMSDNII